MEIEGSKSYQLMKEAKGKYNIHYLLLIFGVIAFVGGILTFIIGPEGFGILMMAIGGMTLIPNALLISLFAPAQIKINKLYEKRASEKLIRYASEEPSIRKGRYIYFAIAALGDMKEEKAIPV